MKTFLSFLLIVAIVVGGFWWNSKHSSVGNNVPPNEEQTVQAISIAQETFAEEHFSGQKPVISGDGTLADAARTYVAQSIADFKIRADKEVPELRKDFGAESPTANYTIDLTAKYMEGKDTQSVVIDSYVYTGGANGNSTYKVFTASKKSGAVLAIGDIIPQTSRDAFVAFVKKKLLDESASGATTLTLFPQDVQALTLNSFDDFAFDEKNVYIYFDKYQIGPGALGAIAYPLSLETVSTYLSAFATDPYRATLTGVQVCLPHKDTSGPQTMECAFGMKTDDGKHYALDLVLMSQTPPEIQNGQRFSASGLVTPIENLSSDHWQKYDIVGIFSVTDSVKVF